MIIHLFNEHPSIINEFLSEIRDKEIQKDRMRFRKNVNRIGQIMAFEISKVLEYKNKMVITPLGVHESPVLKEQPVLATILRAGLPMHNGVLSFFDKSDCAFVSAYRRHAETHLPEIVIEYMACPDLTGKTLILIDPMLASGQSVVLTYHALLGRGKPAHVHIVNLLGSKEGVEHLQQHLPDATLWIADIDENLNHEGYIVPGLGDAGDLSFGEKV